ncbi:DUF5682 family protein [Piscinibacter sp. XHJ-5]|uniref:DUF5682 family protein n=1 Tax=Piscinibacter sp. XHJ-5 TaxID=3037797 RepID=UPI002452A493|nr:DUF5682 family protein [Piscinibacter sp. XHJ-5]
MQNAAELRTAFRQLVGDALILFPVRHHSPACAHHLLHIFEQRRPSVVLVEGPRSFTPLVPLLAHAQARAPFAVYAYAVQRAAGDTPERRRAAYYPFCDYSPELVALRESARRGIPASFIDLDFAEQFVLDRDDAGEEQGSLLAEHHLRRSDYLKALAQQLGCRDHEELWEHLFELPHRDTSTEDFVARIATYCHLARQDATEDGHARDGTHEREAEMAWHIRTALAQRAPQAGPVLVVLGGYHAVAMPRLIQAEVARPAVSRDTLADHHASVIRYSFDRLERLNGYASGMTAPAWHQALWERAQAMDRAGIAGSERLRREVALTMLFDIALELRQRHQLALPVPALSAAYEQALRLAQLRGRCGPARDDVLDAVTSCFIKGQADADGVLVQRAAQRVLGGVALGKVPAGAGVPPLVRDFEARARRQRLRMDDTERRRATLDLYRRPEHRVTSRLFHGLVLLEVPFGVRTAGPDFVNGIGLERLQEHWEYDYSPLTEAALVEASVYGVTLPLAVASRFAQRMQQLEADGQARNARVAASSAVQACVLGLHDHLPRVLQALRVAINEDAAFDAVAAAAGTLGLLWESREPLEARDVPEVMPLLQAAYERSIYLGRDLRGVADDRAGDIVQALQQLRELLVGACGQSLDAGLYWDMVGALRHANDSALLRGASAGLLYSAGRLGEDALGAELNGHLSGMAQPRDAVAYLRGLTQTAREATWQQPALLQVLDVLLAQWDEPAFVAVLPELRLAFAAMTPNETDRIAGAVAGLHGMGDLGPLVHRDLAEDEVRAHLALSETLREVLAADGLSDWLVA